jgi:hypothetical protein
MTAGYRNRIGRQETYHDTDSTFVIYLKRFFGVAAVAGFLALFWHDMFLVDMSQYVRFSWHGVARAWPAFLFGFIFVLLFEKKTVLFESKPVLLMRAAWFSVNAGFWEEICYRWLSFMSAMVLLPFFNAITFGLVHWLYTVIFIPFTNFITFGFMEPHLLTNNWVLGAAVVSAAATFRREHKDKNLVGKIIVWYGGIFLFWMMFSYGIITAMVVHAMYDFIVYGTAIAKKRSCSY